MTLNISKIYQKLTAKSFEKVLEIGHKSLRNFLLCIEKFKTCQYNEYYSIAATPASHEWRSDKEDLSKMFDIATPNPTGSLSGPWFDLTGSGNVTGVKGRNSHLACRVKNLANQTVSQQKTCQTTKNTYTKTCTHARVKAQECRNSPTCFNKNI